MFKLKLCDREGTILKEKDIVKISDGRFFNFFSEVKYLENEQAIAPFHTFAFHSIVKVDSIPDTAKKGNEDRYNIWYDVDPEVDKCAELHEKYFLDWRDCERLINNKAFIIEKEDV